MDKRKLWIVDCACCRSRGTSSTSRSGVQVNGKFLGGAHGVQSNNAQPKSVLVPRTNARQKAHVEAFERQTGKGKKANGLAKPMLLPGISHGDKVVPCLHFLLGTGNHLSLVARVQKARTLKNSTTKTQWPSLKRVNSATS